MDVAGQIREWASGMISGRPTPLWSELPCSTAGLDDTRRIGSGVFRRGCLTIRPEACWDATSDREWA